LATERLEKEEERGKRTTDLDFGGQLQLLGLEFDDLAALVLDGDGLAVHKCKAEAEVIVADSMPSVERPEHSPAHVGVYGRVVDLAQAKRGLPVRAAQHMTLVHLNVQQVVRQTRQALFGDT
jgi:hypothetical protein